MISREVEVASYKDVCWGEKSRINIGYIKSHQAMKVENNKLIEYPTERVVLRLSLIWEIFTKFFSIHNIEPNWLNCHSAGYHDEDLGAWTGCLGKV